MHAITGVTGQVGGIVAGTLIEAGERVRTIVRDEGKGRPWAERGAEVAVADFGNPDALTAAFRGAESVFILPPPVFDPTPGFDEARALAAMLVEALTAAKPERVVHLSTIGAQAAETNLLTQHTILENALRGLAMPITFLRPAWFLENCAWDVAPARETGVIPSYLQPLDRPIPMVATADIGRVAAGLLRESWSGQRLVELEGPRRVSPNDIAAAFTKILGKPVRMESVPRDEWERIFRSQGMRNPGPRARMVDGFNEGWIAFEGEARRGEVGLETILQGLVDRA